MVSGRLARRRTLQNLPKVSWEGGPGYWAKFTKAKAQSWDCPGFLPISVFLVKAEAFANHPAQLAALGVNTAMGVEHQPPISDLTDHLFAIVPSPISHADELPNTWTQAEIGDDPKVVSWFIYDECEQGEGACALPGGDENEILALFEGWAEDTRAYNDGRFLFANFGNGVLNTFWAPNTMSDFIAAVDGCACDKYAYTSTVSRFEIERSPDWPLGDTPVDNSNRAAAYGWFIDQMRTFDAVNPIRRPQWGFFETKMPFLGGTDAEIILYAELEGAVWSSICHEARGIAYFQHNGFYEAVPTIDDPNTGVTATTETYSLVDGPAGLKAIVTAINAKVRGLAPVINTQSYVFNFGATGIDTMFKQYQGDAYIFASLDPAGSTGSKTFTLPRGIKGKTVDVVGEGRKIAVSAGRFTDTFSNEYTHHVYRVAI